MPRCQNVTKLQIDNRSLNVALKQKVEHFALQIIMGLLRIASEVEGKRPIDNILNYVNSYTDSNMVKIHCTDTGETVSSSVTALLFYPLFCGMEQMEEVFIPGVSREEVELLLALPLSDTSRFGGLFP